MKWFIKSIYKYAKFSGRAQRKEFWMYTLFYIIFGTILWYIDTTHSVNIGNDKYGILFLFYNLVLLLPTLGVSVRRLHDVDESGWMLLLFVIPVIGFLWLLVLFLTTGSKKDNKYGKSPLLVNSLD